MDEYPRFSESKKVDLLAEWAESKQRRNKLAWGAAFALLGAFGFGVLVEAAINGSYYVFGTVFLLACALFIIGVALGYSAFLFFLAWTFASWRMENGQTRPSIAQGALTVALSFLTSVPVALAVAREPLRMELWTIVILFVWSNASVTLLGYCVRFVVRAHVEEERAKLIKQMRERSLADRQDS